MKEIRRKGDLPPLKEGFVRLVHLTNKKSISEIIKSGLRYNGDLSTTARWWSNESNVELDSSDIRFMGISALVVDIPTQDIRTHMNVCTAPGFISLGGYDIYVLYR